MHENDDNFRSTDISNTVRLQNNRNFVAILINATGINGSAHRQLSLGYAHSANVSNTGYLRANIQFRYVRHCHRQYECGGENMLFSSRIFVFTNIQNESDCARSCYSNAFCMSANFDTETQACELNLQTKLEIPSVGD